MFDTPTPTGRVIGWVTLSHTAVPLAAPSRVSGAVASTALVASFTKVTWPELGVADRERDRQEAAAGRLGLEADAGVGVDGGIAEPDEVGHLQEPRCVGLCGLHVHEAGATGRPRAVVGSALVVVVGRVDQDVQVRGGRVADLGVVGAATGCRRPGVLAGLRADVGVAARHGRIQAASGQRGRVDLQLQVPLVLVPVADVDHERGQHDDHRERDGDQHEHAAALGVGVHGSHDEHPTTDPFQFSSRIVSLACTVVWVAERPRNGSQL